jgi:hypothetical protein
MAALRRFETPPSKQAQVDWGHLGDLMAGAAHRIPDKATFYGLRALPGRGLAAYYSRLRSSRVCTRIPLK